MIQTQELATAIGGLYRAFEGYRLRENTDPCPCCHSPQDAERIRKKILRKLDYGDLYEYVQDALYTWGGEADYKHFLPRIFELLTLPDPKGAFVDPEVAFVKLTYSSSDSTSWRTWPPAEQRAISSYFHALWEAVLDSDPEDLGLGGAYDWICAIAQAEHDLSPYLNLWLAASSGNAHRNLARMISQEGLPNTAKPGPGYWEERREQWEQIVAWLRRPNVRRKLDIAFEKWAGAPFANELVDAAVLLPSTQ
jgi:hypothetical protein